MNPETQTAPESITDPNKQLADLIGTDENVRKTVAVFLRFTKDTLYAPYGENSGNEYADAERVERPHLLFAGIAPDGKLIAVTGNNGEDVESRLHALIFDPKTGTSYGLVPHEEIQTQGPGPLYKDILAYVRGDSLPPGTRPNVPHTQIRLNYDNPGSHFVELSFLDSYADPIRFSRANTAMFTETIMKLEAAEDLAKKMAEIAMLDGLFNDDPKLVNA